MIIEEMSWKEIDEALGLTRTVILPVGATEEHGPHLPVFTDTLQAVEVAREIARRRPIFVAPAISYGVCRSTRGFPGTISIGQEALRLLAKDILLSLYDNGFRFVLVLAGHAGGQHMASLKEACSQVVALREIRVSLVTDFDFIVDGVETPGDGHAGEIETSRMLYHREDLVKGLPEGGFPERPRYLILRDVRHLMGDGIMGDPSKATREKGRMFFEAAVDGVLKVIDELENYPEAP